MITTKLTCLGVLLFAAISSRAETVRVRVLNGRNGKPVANEHVQVWVNGRTGKALDLVTGSDGATSLEAPKGSSVEVESNLYWDCRPFQRAEPRSVYSTDEIVLSGIAAINTCGKLSAEAKRGELLFFVRPMHWWEGIRR